MSEHDKEFRRRGLASLARYFDRTLQIGLNLQSAWALRCAETGAGRSILEEFDVQTQMGF